jgi:hypothetical protein
LRSRKPKDWGNLKSSSKVEDRPASFVVFEVFRLGELKEIGHGRRAIRSFVATSPLIADSAEMLERPSGRVGASV